ncbi:hypothetical protein HK102_006977, partial [Quaeritorhiza haematococci]
MRAFGWVEGQVGAGVLGEVLGGEEGSQSSITGVGNGASEEAQRGTKRSGGKGEEKVEEKGKEVDPALAQKMSSLSLSETTNGGGNEGAQANVSVQILNSLMAGTSSPSPSIPAQHSPPSSSSSPPRSQSSSSPPSHVTNTQQTHSSTLPIPKSHFPPDVSPHVKFFLQLTCGRSNALILPPIGNLNANRTEGVLVGAVELPRAVTWSCRLEGGLSGINVEDAAGNGNGGGNAAGVTAGEGEGIRGIPVKTYWRSPMSGLSILPPEKNEVKGAEGAMTKTAAGKGKVKSAFQATKQNGEGDDDEKPTPPPSYVYAAVASLVMLSNVHNRCTVALAGVTVLPSSPVWTLRLMAITPDPRDVRLFLSDAYHAMNARHAFAPYLLCSKLNHVSSEYNDYGRRGDGCMLGRGGRLTAMDVGELNNLRRALGDLFVKGQGLLEGSVGELLVERMETVAKRVYECGKRKREEEQREKARKKSSLNGTKSPKGKKGAQRWKQMRRRYVDEDESEESDVKNESDEDSEEEEVPPPPPPKPYWTSMNAEALPTPTKIKASSIFLGPPGVGITTALGKSAAIPREVVQVPIPDVPTPTFVFGSAGGFPKQEGESSTTGNRSTTTTDKKKTTPPSGPTATFNFTFQPSPVKPTNFPSNTATSSYDLSNQDEDDGYERLYPPFRWPAYSPPKDWREATASRKPGSFQPPHGWRESLKSRKAMDRLDDYDDDYFKDYSSDSDEDYSDDDSFDSEDADRFVYLSDDEDDDEGFVYKYG